ncbi:hypothetical protein PPTG_23407 [Phytophthora nicotianae INRA-310]|uniref:Uncharacterized protein n=1 Tax=Phytophthora nicotianae (strain INRA-310) TaxID=761204 RepID=W2PZM6_PHYN3|nr:hypothetical protein PPTG_23407 [Phytophthora nicotianae INRA-310]ETN06106.1 hypothetical protein PPTG_23407 [Phytophthora nicotianae INRA-310]
MANASCGRLHLDDRILGPIRPLDPICIMVRCRARHATTAARSGARSGRSCRRHLGRGQLGLPLPRHGALVIKTRDWDRVSGSVQVEVVPPLSPALLRPCHALPCRGHVEWCIAGGSARELPTAQLAEPTPVLAIARQAQLGAKIAADEHCPL